jgi:hypothetical protein
MRIFPYPRGSWLPSDSARWSWPPRRFPGRPGGPGPAIRNVAPRFRVVGKSLTGAGFQKKRLASTFRRGASIFLAAEIYAIRCFTLDEVVRGWARIAAILVGDGRGWPPDDLLEVGPG